MRVEVRERYYYGSFIEEKEWPIKRTRYQKMYLDLNSQKLAIENPKAVCEAKYNSTDKKDRLVFRHTFPEDVALVGHAKLHLSIALPNHDDGDVFAGLRKVDRLGNVVNLVFFTVHEAGVLTIGCQRVSHRELDEAKSEEYQPYLKHERLQKLAEGDVRAQLGNGGPSAETMKSKGKFCELDIELLPFTGRIRHGESIELLIQGSDIVQMEPALVQKHEDTVNHGDHIVYSGGECQSYIVLPFLDDVKLGAPWGGLP